MTPPPYFKLSFVVMLLGAVAFLVGGALTRNVVVSRTKGTSWIDAALESGSVALAALGVFCLLWKYPRIARRRHLPLYPYLLFIAGGVVFGGILLFWALWYGQVPGISALGK